MRYSIQPKNRKHVQGYGFLSLARKFGSKCGKKFVNTGISNSKYGKKIIDTTKKQVLNLLK